TRGERWRGLPATELQDGLRVHHPRIVCVPKYLKALDGLTYGLSLVPFLARHRQRFPFDVIDAHFAYPDGTAAILLGKIFRCPVTITLRGTIVPLSRFRLRRPQIAWTLAQASRIFAVSESLRDVAVSLGAPPDKIRVIANGVDSET